MCAPILLQSRCSGLGLKCIDEIRPLITKLVDLVLGLPLNPIVSLASPSLRILPLQQYILKNAAAQKECCLVTEDGCVAGLVPRLIVRTVYVRADDAVEVAPSDHESERDSTFVYTLDVVSSPGDGVGNARINAHSSEKGTSVLDVRIARA